MIPLGIVRSLNQLHIHEFKGWQKNSKLFIESVLKQQGGWKMFADDCGKEDTDMHQLCACFQALPFQPPVLMETFVLC